MKKNTLLGGLTPAQFMRDYWHKKPLLIRRAVPQAAPILSAPALFDLAARVDVESRLISRRAGQWDLQRGPFAAMPIVQGHSQDWTLLVQGVNLHDDRADNLLRQFRFIPDSRLDDLMISYATDGGGVGAHVDSYDVFLLQSQGRRRWRISGQRDLSLVAGLPLKILKNFAAEQEYVLDPGDMLYLPPQYAHEGVALGECITCSIGLRAPVFQELGEAFLQFMAESIDLPGRYADPSLKPTANPAKLDSIMLSAVAAQLHKIRFTDDDIAIFLGEYLSEPAASVIFSPPKRALAPNRFAAAAAKHGVALSPKSRMLYRGGYFFFNGESFAARTADRRVLVKLADRRMLDPAALTGLSADVSEAMHLWYCDGWLALR